MAQPPIERERPGNTPVEQQERSANDTDRTHADRLAISGPGAADFLTAQGGSDLPGTSGSTKGMTQTRGDDGPLTEGAKRLVPRLAPDPSGSPGVSREYEGVTGSQTGTIGGGGPEAHNPSPVRVTGVDDPSVPAGNSSDQDQVGGGRRRRDRDR